MAKKVSKKAPAHKTIKKAHPKTVAAKAAQQRSKKTAGKIVKKAIRKKKTHKTEVPVTNKEVMSCKEIMVYKLKNEYKIADIMTSDSNLIVFTDDLAEYMILIEDEHDIKFMITDIAQFPEFAEEEYVFTVENDLAYFDEFMQNRNEFVQEIINELGEAEWEEEEGMEDVTMDNYIIIEERGPETEEEENIRNLNAKIID